MDIQNKAAIKIQYYIKLNYCIKLLDKFNKLNLELYSNKLSFYEFQRVIIKKEIIQTTRKFIRSLNIFKKELTINPRVLISTYLFSFYSDEFLGSNTEKHPFDLHLINLSKNIIKLFHTKNINELWELLNQYNFIFNNWIQMDKNRSIEQLIISYYYRSIHIEKINSDEFKKAPLSDETTDKQKKDMIQELENQRSEIISSIQIIDKSFDIDYLINNYKELYNNIQNAWKDINNNITNIIKKAFIDKLQLDIINGDMLSFYELINEIKIKLINLCPEKRKKSFENKFNNYNIKDILINSDFNKKLFDFIIFIIDFIILMDAPCNDDKNILWKKETIELMKNDFSNNFPKILFDINENIDNIYNLIKNIKK